MDKTEGQYPSCSVLIIDSGSGEALEIGDLLADNARAVSLKTEVKLLAQAAFQLAYDLREAITPTKRGVSGGKARNLLQNLDVDLDALAYAGTLDFDGDFVPIPQCGAVDLRHRSGGERRGVE